MKPLDNELLGITVEKHSVYPPASLSAEARRYLSMASQLPPWAPYPSPDDKPGWRRWAAALDELTRRFMSGVDLGAEVTSEEISLGGVRTYVSVPRRRSAADPGKAYLDIHGGALIVGGGDICRHTGMSVALRIGVTTYAVDYRMPPDHPYPAALDDCLRSYCALLKTHRPQDIIVGGLSAGGNLAAALMLRLVDHGIALPAGLVLLSPELDLTESGDSFQINRPVEVFVRNSLVEINRLYANGHPLTHPYLSPLFGDFTKGFPRCFLQAGTRDVFLSNVARMHRALRRAGIPVELRLDEGMPHAGFFGAPEDMEMGNDVREFCLRCWGGQGSIP